MAFRGIREEALLGARTTLDVLNAEQELLDARASSISAGIDEQIAAFAPFCIQMLIFPRFCSKSSKQRVNE